MEMKCPICNKLTIKENYYGSYTEFRCEKVTETEGKYFTEFWIHIFESEFFTLGIHFKRNNIDYYLNIFEYTVKLQTFEEHSDIFFDRKIADEIFIENLNESLPKLLDKLLILKEFL